MKRLPALVAFLALLCCTRSGPRIDGSSDDNLLGSIEVVRTSLPENRRQSFDDALSTISIAIRSKVDFTDVGVGAETMRAVLRKALNGKTGEDVIAYADDLKRGVQRVPEVAASDRATNGTERPPLVVGESVNMSGNSFSANVSAKFGEPELRRLHAELNGLAAKAKLQSYVCNPVPAFTITVVLWYEAPYQERLVRMQMTPPLYKTDGQIEGAIGYLFEHGVKTIDKGPPIDYGYRRPDGSPIPHVDLDSYPEPKAADCGAAATHT